MRKSKNPAQPQQNQSAAMVANYLFIDSKPLARCYRNMFVEMVFNYAYCSVGIDAATREDFKRMHLHWLMLGEVEQAV